jgi:hypothetical protein
MSNLWNSKASTVVTYHDAIVMSSFMFLEFPAGTETRRTYVYAFSSFANWICAFYAYGVCEIAHAGVTFDLQAWLIDRYGIERD